MQFAATWLDLEDIMLRERWDREGCDVREKQPVDLGLLEEDDKFQEFPAEDWAGLDEDEDSHVWEDNWDDDNVEDDFSNQLRAELEKHGYKGLKW
ncbi:26S proteasome complex subunit SEM1-like [Sorex araneus]|uniref:26S proteasome complex subunit SEM1-like n=1 Tax=Sorex araneus TaxID=42254 RepID=UPI0024336AD0|nr:26S proteasome complex subunit SEM1-like [Sorex araneus]